MLFKLVYCVKIKNLVSLFFSLNFEQQTILKLIINFVWKNLTNCKKNYNRKCDNYYYLVFQSNCVCCNKLIKKVSDNTFAVQWRCETQKPLLPKTSTRPRNNETMF